MVSYIRTYNSYFFLTLIIIHRCKTHRRDANRAVGVGRTFGGGLIQSHISEGNTDRHSMARHGGVGYKLVTCMVREAHFTSNPSTWAVKFPATARFSC